MRAMQLRKITALENSTVQIGKAEKKGRKI